MMSSLFARFRVDSFYAFERVQIQFVEQKINLYNKYISIYRIFFMKKIFIAYNIKFKIDNNILTLLLNENYYYFIKFFKNKIIL